MLVTATTVILLDILHCSTVVSGQKSLQLTNVLLRTSNFPGVEVPVQTPSGMLTQPTLVIDGIFALSRFQ